MHKSCSESTQKQPEARRTRNREQSRKLSEMAKLETAGKFQQAEHYST